MKAKIILGFSAFALLAGIIGTVDINTYNGNHSISGYIVNNKVIADNGNTYSASNFDSKGKVKVTLDGHGNVISMTIEQQKGETL